MQNGVKTYEGWRRSTQERKEEKSLQKFNWTVWDQEEIFKETWNTPSSQDLFNCRFIDCIEKVGLIWFNAFYIRYNIFNIQCTKRKKNIQVQEIFKNTHRPESPVCQQKKYQKKSALNSWTTRFTWQLEQLQKSKSPTRNIKHSSWFFQILLMLKFLLLIFTSLTHILYTLHCTHPSPALNYTFFQLSVNFSSHKGFPEGLILHLKGHSTNFTVQSICLGVTWNTTVPMNSCCLCHRGEGSWNCVLNSSSKWLKRCWTHS